MGPVSLARGLCTLKAVCGRYTLLTETYDIADWFQLEMTFPPVSRYNIAPSYSSTNPPPIVRLGENGAREIVPARWWLIPSWWKKPLKELPTAFNARAEDIATKPMFRTAFRRHRCLVPATGWYEFKGTAGNKESYHFHLPERGPLAFGGVWERWTSPENETVDSFAILTTQPNETARAIHNRMPLIIEPADYARWLAPIELGDAADELCSAYAKGLTVYRTRAFGNDPRREGPECVERFSE